MTAHFVDAFLSQTRLTVTRPLFQLVGAAAALIAAKVCHADQSALTPWRLARLSSGNFEPRDLVRMERRVLRVLRYDTLVVTPLAFLPDLIPAGQRHTEQFRVLCTEVATLSLFCEAHMQTPALERAALAVRKARLVVCDTRAAAALIAALEALHTGSSAAECRIAQDAAALFGTRDTEHCHTHSCHALQRQTLSRQTLSQETLSRQALSQQAPPRQPPAWQSAIHDASAWQSAG